MNTVFLDTAALYAAADRTSDRHLDCASAFEGLVRSGANLVTTTLILAELHTLTLRRAGAAAGFRAVGALTDSLRVEVAGVDRAAIDAAMDFLAKRPNRAISLADAISFGVMRERSIDTAFTLDADYEAEGFRIVPAS